MRPAKVPAAVPSAHDVPPTEAAPAASDRASATQAATGHRAGGCEVPRASPSAEHGLDRGQQVLTI